MRAVLLINPASGRGAGRKLAPRITAELSGLGIEPQLYYSESPGHITRLVQQQLQSRPELLMVAGGDGSVHEAVNGWMLAGGGAPLAVIPIGTGNDFSKMLAAGADWHAACASIAKGRIRHVDVGRCNDFYFANSLGVGFDAQVALTANRIQWLGGQLVYSAAVMHTLLFKHLTPKVRLLHDGSTLESRITLIAVGNGCCEGGAFKLAPHAIIDDGQFDVIVAQALSRLGILRLVPQVLRGTHLGRPGIVDFRTQRLLIESDSGLPVHADGEIRYTDARLLEISIEPKKLSVVA
ncbi:MAG: diacylglycerol kinase family lipid kinase [Gammaproteobacteria bacterium]|nr:diacylglycerol kinase family lipid kinase [Gammaproteobacteria bacterium]